MEKPKIIRDVNLEPLKEICQQYIDFVDNDEEFYEYNYYAHYIYEKALETIFGKDVWEFINKRRP